MRHRFGYTPAGLWPLLRWPLLRWPLLLGLACAADPRAPGLPESATEGARAGDVAQQVPDTEAGPAPAGSPSLQPAGAQSDDGVSMDLPLAAPPASDSTRAQSPADAGSALGSDAGALAPPPPDLSLPAGVTSRFPSAGASGVCADVPLRLSFGSQVALGSRGSIKIFASDTPDAPIDSIDLAAASYTDTIAGRATNLARPVFVDGQDASVYFHRGVLEPHRSYFVTIDPGVFVGATGAPLAAITDTSWSFSTGPTPTGSSSMLVDREGHGDFCTLQSALDAVPARNTEPVTIELRSGIYHEIGYLARKSNVTLHGEGRDTTLIAYPNNERLNPGTAARAMLTALDSDDFVVDGLTLYNTTPQNGGQAEALRVRGDRAILRNASFKSLQDTLLLEGRVYVADSYVEGNVDFVWGVGAAYFERSEIKIVGRSGVIVQARNGVDAPGYFFVDSRLTSDPGITGSTLARIDASVYPGSQVAYINCQMGPHISPEGWTVTPAGTTATGSLRFWEFGSTDLQGRVLDVSRRHPASRQLGPAEAASLRNRASVLGGWDPAL